jgi:serine/threonine protein kinase
MGTGSNSHVLYLLDFGLSKKYYEEKTRLHIKFTDGNSMTGTARYASIHTHLGLGILPPITLYHHNIHS